jgi:hypothetical protein
LEKRDKNIKKNKIPNHVLTENLFIKFYPGYKNETINTTEIRPQNSTQQAAETSTRKIPQVGEKQENRDIDG